ncbi:hypothetical protein D3C76_889470 [compost metagenome]
MRTNGKQPVVLLALNQADANADIALLKSVGVTEIQGGTGCYQGKQEQCYAIPVEQFTDAVKALLREHNQACVMYLDNQYNAWLAYQQGNYVGYNAGPDEVMATYVGEFKSSTQQQAEKFGNWTRFGGQYYVARR